MHGLVNARWSILNLASIPQQPQAAKHCYGPLSKKAAVEQTRDLVCSKTKRAEQTYYQPASTSSSERRPLNPFRRTDCQKNEVIIREGWVVPPIPYTPILVLLAPQILRLLIKSLLSFSSPQALPLSRALSSS